MDQCESLGRWRRDPPYLEGSPSPKGSPASAGLWYEFEELSFALCSSQISQDSITVGRLPATGIRATTATRCSAILDLVAPPELVGGPLPCAVDAFPCCQGAFPGTFSNIGGLFYATAQASCCHDPHCEATRKRRCHRHHAFNQGVQDGGHNQKFKSDGQHVLVAIHRDL